ncbi:two-component system, OmpR family, response regulator MprA [Deinococcus hopiensis KR-140]|uniref:Two-component system, OmpR family, response regulator MprA n=1 Tax=Deinococcus hopiensis KR-140 TaxID=695939 RepID=A0A1W1VUX4_9DEIO|nr:two-component system, OmpR family, response regulator MprA [Deinococcus hopiensis KR-140]
MPGNVSLPLSLPRLLIVEDDPGIRDYLQMGLRYEGFEVSTAPTAGEGLSRYAEEGADLIILDVMLPGPDGFAFLRDLRSRTPVPVLMLTARDSVEDRIRGLEGGADDYLVKPFAFGELVARIRTVLRRARPDIVELARYADLELNAATREAFRAGRRLDLRPTTFDLLLFLTRHSERVLPKQIILDAVWGQGFLGSDNVVELYVGYARRALGDPPLLHTLRGAGYLLQERQ